MTDTTDTTTDLPLRARVSELESRVEFLTNISSELVDILAAIVAGSGHPLHESLLSLLPTQDDEVQHRHLQGGGENLSQSPVNVTVSVTPPDVSIHSEPGAGHDPRPKFCVPSTTADSSPKARLTLVQNPQ